MKKIMAIVVVLLLIVGCSNRNDQYYEEKLKKYEAYWNVLLNEDKFQTQSRNFDIEAELIKNGETYEYYISIDNPKIAMYDVEVMVVENKMPFDGNVEMVPSAGIFENDTYTLIPNQVREDKGFKKGILLGKLDVSEPKINIRVLVIWKNYTKLESKREVFEFNLEYVEPTQEQETGA